MAGRTMELLADERGHEPDLAALAHQARGGSATAFDALARGVRTRVREWARTVTGDDDDAEDVAQLVLLKLHRHVARFDGRSRFTTWLFRVTRNVAFTRAARDRRRAGLLARRCAEAVLEGTTDGAAPGGLAELVWFYHTELPPRQREVFALADLDGVAPTDVARRLGIAPATVRGLLMKARRRIRLRVLESHAALLEDYEP